jgi:type I restriction enzyme S subunit
MTQPTALTPKLRFPEFRDDPAWESKELHTLADPVSDRADGEDQNNILTLSGEQGLVLQSEYFGKQIAGTNSERYLKIQRDDFVYNDRTTKASEYGTIKRLTKHPHGIVSPIYKCFRFKSGERPVFWEWYFESGAHEAQLRSLANEGARAGRFNVSIDRFLSTSVYTPERDTAEQQKIAECLSTLDDLIGAESQKLDALKAHKKGLMQQIFPREGETLPRLRVPQFINAGSWEETRLSQMGELVSGLTYSPDDVRESGLLVLRSSNVQNGEIALNDNVYVDPSIKGVNLSQPDDILICVRNGSKALIGKSALIPKGMPLCTHGAFMTVFRARAPRFVFQLFQTARYQKQVAGDLGATINSINGSQFLKYKFVVPKPAEQNRIATCLSSLDELIAAQRDRLTALQTHKQGLLQQLFPSPADTSA